VKHKIYISGPPNGDFRAMEKQVVAAGHTALNPAWDTKGPGDLQEHIRVNLRMLTNATAITYLPHFTQSKQCRLEAYLAQLLGLPEITGEQLLVMEARLIDLNRPLNA
jgi:hypothetical protein